MAEQESKKEKTSTKTLEINIQERRESDIASAALAKTDPTIQINRQDIEKKEKQTQILLHAKDVLKEKEAGDEIEFSASTAVFQLSDVMNQSLASGETSEDSTVAVKINKGLSDDEKVLEIKRKVKAHYLKKAQILEAEIAKILSGFKTNNPAIIKRIDMIKKLLARHSGRE